MILRAEFTTEPFEGEGDPPAHALAARDCLHGAGLDAEFGPLGTSTTGPRETVVPALASVIDAALAHGAHQVTLQVTVDETDDES